MDMGRDIRYRYSVEMTIIRGTATPAGWPTRNSVGNLRPAALLGKPNAAKLAQYVADYNASLAAGGVNAHIGQSGACIAARIIDHDDNRAVVATWQAAVSETTGRLIY
jgi:hypothetical protein